MEIAGSKAGFEATGSKHAGYFEFAPAALCDQGFADNVPKSCPLAFSHFKISCSHR